MSTWTSSAESELQEYFQRLRQPLQRAGADPAEVMDDLRRHIEEEAASERLRIVTEADLKRLLARIGEPFQALLPARANETSLLEEPSPHLNSPRTAPIPEPESFRTEPEHKPPPLQDRKRANPPGATLLIFGVIVPACVVIGEYLTGFCGSVFFDPLPTWKHFLLALAVPVINGLLWTGLKNRSIANYSLASGLNACAIGISLFYTMAFSVLIVLGVPAIVFFGLGLLPMTPLFALVTAITLRRKLRQAAGEARADCKFRRAHGLALGLAALVLLDGRELFTRVLMQMTLSQSPAKQKTGLNLLRSVGSERAILEQCQPRNRRRGLPLLDWITFYSLSVAPEKAQAIYFQVTGGSHSSRPSALREPLFGEALNMGFRQRDFHQGTTVIGPLLPGVSLQSSRLDATVDPLSASVYSEWTMVFHNASAVQTEARSEILLPSGGVVSRLTLWVDGEEREAAFAGRSQVREAYQNVVQTRRDPVLVTTSGPDRVLVQCFPIQPSGGTMKIRIGVTAPLQIRNASEATLALPVILEKNFAFEPKLATAVWIESPAALAKSQGGEFSTAGPSGRHLLRANFVLGNGMPSIRVRHDFAGQTSWARDTRSTPPASIRQTVQPVTAKSDGKLLIVLDTSASMADVVPELEKFLKNFPPEMDAWMILADDEPALIRLRPGMEMPKVKFTGGKDNLPALERAIELASGAKQGAIVWAHGPQPILGSTPEFLLQTIERTSRRLLFYDLPVKPGPNALLNACQQAFGVRTIVPSASLGEELLQIAREFHGLQPAYHLIREKTSEAPAAYASGEASFHLVRLWAFDRIKQQISERDPAEAIKLAQRYQLVTPVSGAVVLETKAQFDAAGLKPVDVSSVPVVPEPTVLVLLLVGGVLMFYQARKRRNQIGA